MKPNPIYNAAYLGHSIDNVNVKIYTGHPFEYWCNISGLFASGLPPNFIRYVDFTLSGTYPTFKIQAQNMNVEHVEIEFDLYNNFIYDHYIMLKDRQNGYGKIGFSEHIELAEKGGFDHLECYAYGGLFDVDKKFNGHITWARFGFTMQPKSEAMFLEFMKRNGKAHITSIHQLLSIPAEKLWWKDEGLPWYGVFDLAPGSPNRKLWEKY